MYQFFSEKGISVGLQKPDHQQRQWCSGNMKPFQGLAGGSIPP